ncbi:hypothetical protein MBANPS3_001683 [Mucor bainieri]
MFIVWLRYSQETTAIDPSDDISQAFKTSTGSDVHFLKEDIFTFKSGQPLDLVLFSKSLHHCNPVDQALKNAYGLLAENGMLISEEIQFEMIYNNGDVAWFLNRIDLPIMTRIMDTSLPISQRWLKPHTHGGKSEHDHAHGEQHQLHEKLSDEEQRKLDREVPDKIASSNAIRIAIDAQFGKENI